MREQLQRRCIIVPAIRTHNSIETLFVLFPTSCAIKLWHFRRRERRLSRGTYNLRNNRFSVRRSGLARGAVYQYVTLPFRLSTAPFIFTLFMREVMIVLHKLNIEIHMHLDDWLRRVKSQAVLQRNISVYIISVRTARSRSKRRTIRAHSEIHLSGISANTRSSMVYPPQTKVDDLITFVVDPSRGRGKQTNSWLQFNKCIQQYQLRLSYTITKHRRESFLNKCT